jgi:hypothetical protein
MISSEALFIPIDILLILCTTLIILLAVFFLIIIILDKTCHTISMMFVANSCVSALIVGCVTFNMSLFTIQNDLKQITHQDPLCVIRAYLGYASYGVLNCSFFLQALYRYVIVVYPNRLVWQSVSVQALAIGLTWIYGFSYCAPFVFTNSIIYNVDNQICQLPLELSFFEIYGALCGYTIPTQEIHGGSDAVGSE